MRISVYPGDCQPSWNRRDLPQKIAIVGGGPAGLSTAFCRKMAYPVTVFERVPSGGMLLNGIPSFRLRKTSLTREIEVLM